jgi:hypothetical protein
MADKIIGVAEVMSGLTGRYRQQALEQMWEYY